MSEFDAIFAIGTTTVLLLGVVAGRATAVVQMSVPAWVSGCSGWPSTLIGRPMVS